MVCTHSRRKLQLWIRSQVKIIRSQIRPMVRMMVRIRRSSSKMTSQPSGRRGPWRKLKELAICTNLARSITICIVGQRTPENSFTSSKRRSRNSHLRSTSLTSSISSIIGSLSVAIPLRATNSSSAILSTAKMKRCLTFARAERSKNQSSASLTTHVCHPPSL